MVRRFFLIHPVLGNLRNINLTARKFMTYILLMKWLLLLKN